MTTVELRTTAMAVGGEAVAREESGRVVFVAGGAVDETVRVELDEERRTFARGRVIEVLDASPDRVAPPCPHHRQGCGGCDWQHLSLDAQRRGRQDQVREALERTGGIEDPTIVAGPTVASEGLRTTIRGVADESGQFSFHRRRSGELIPVDSCLVAHPAVQELVAVGRFSRGDVTIRVGARTGERMVIVSDPTATSVPDGVTVVGSAELRSGRRHWLHEEAAGRRWRISAQSFFQASPEGAEALVDVVGGEVDRFGPDAARVVDLCAGVGLFAGTVGAGRRTVAVERSSSAVADAKVNLADLGTRMIKVAMAAWRPSRADLVIADPARTGLGRPGVDVIAATGAALCVLVSCDVGALGRDAKLLTAAGYRLERATTLDLFAHTAQVEVVSTFRRI